MALSQLRAGDPQQLGNYEILGRLGAGGQGVVYLGQSPAGERVSIKVLHYDVDEAFLIRELAMMRQVASFCTARVLDAQVTGNTWYIVSEYIDGRSLADVVEHDGPITGGSLERLAVGTVTALTAIHQTGVVHRDFKPANILLGPDGPRVIDFGIARTLDVTTTAGEIRGTPAYMAPEQINGQSAGTAADMFAWAAVMAYAASGRSPFGSDTLPAIIMRVLQEQPDLHELTGTLHEVVSACLAKDPAARPPAPEVLIRLLGHTPAVPIQALREGTVLAGSVGLPAAAASQAPPAQHPLAQAATPQPPTPQPATRQSPTQPPPPAQPPPPHQPTRPQPAVGYPPAGYPPVGFPPATPWAGGGAPPEPPRQRSSRLTRLLVPIAAVVIVAVGAVIGLALTGAFAGTKHGAAAPSAPARTGRPSVRTSPTHSRRAPVRTSPSRAHSHRAPVQPSPAPTHSSQAPVQPTPTPTPTSPAPVHTTPAGGGPVSTIPLDLGGQWSGTGHQPGDDQTPTYSITISLSGGNTTGSTSYSSLGCQGQLTLLSGSTANSVKLREQITSGPCTSTGVFTVSLKNGNLIFNYEPGDSSDPASYGTLHS